MKYHKAVRDYEPNMLGGQKSSNDLAVRKNARLVELREIP